MILKKATYTHFEDLPNEIFFEIFDYLHALQIFTGFSSLNQRISSILQLIPLRIIILHEHSRRQIDFLCSYLHFHAHQVISLKIYDTIRDYSSTINLLFNRHYFINLELCTFISINSSTNLQNVIQQIKSLNRLVSVTIRQPYDGNMNENDKYDLTRIILTHESSSLRSIALLYRHNHLDISNYTSINSNLKSLELLISGSRSTVSVYSILPILRLCHTIQYLTITIEEKDNANVPIARPFINDNDLPILPQIIYFNLRILARCDNRSIGYILRCMPNLIHFYFHLTIRKASWPFPGELLNGYVWQQMLESYVPYLSKFEFNMSILKRRPKLDLDSIINSFEYFVTKYNNWHIIINRWKYRSREEYAILHTFNYHKHKYSMNINIPFIHWNSFETRSTATTNDHHVFYSNMKILRIYLIMNIRPTIPWSSPLFQQVNCLVVQMPKIPSSFWNNLLNMVNFGQIDDNDHVEQSVNYLSRFIYLPKVNEIKFPSYFNISGWRYAQFILQACPNVSNLCIITRLLVLSKFIDNPSLLPIFKRIKTIVSIADDIYIPSSFSSKFVERFPSLCQVGLQVFSFDNCVFIIDECLNHLKNLSCIKIHYYQDTLLDDPFSRDYIIEKRRETFPNNIINEQMVIVKNNGEAVEIRLA